MPKKLFDCTKCGGAHERPINSKCNSSNKNVMNVPDSNALILQELKNLSSRTTVMEQKVNDRESHIVSPSGRSIFSNPQEDDDYVLPSISTLKQSKQIQKQVDDRVKQLQAMNEQGTFKSQRWGMKPYMSRKRSPGPITMSWGV